MPTPCENRGGASASVRAGGPSRGRTRRRYTTPYGAYRSPNTAPTANTSSCAASSQALPVIRTTASTMVVITAPNRGPRGSMSMVMLLAISRPLSSAAAVPRRVVAAPGSAGRGAARSGDQGSRTRTDGGGDVAEVDGAPLGQHLRGQGHHEPDGIRAESGCHSRLPCGPGPWATDPSAAITSALRGRPTARP